MAFPYQCLTVGTRPGAGGEDWAVFGATSSTLVVQSSSGTKSVWPAEQDAKDVSCFGVIRRLSSDSLEFGVVESVYAEGARIRDRMIKAKSPQESESNCLIPLAQRATFHL